MQAKPEDVIGRKTFGYLEIKRIRTSTLKVVTPPVIQPPRPWANVEVDRVVCSRSTTITRRNLDRKSTDLRPHSYGIVWRLGRGTTNYLCQDDRYNEEHRTTCPLTASCKARLPLLRDPVNQPNQVDSDSELVVIPTWLKHFLEV